MKTTPRIIASICILSIFVASNLSADSGPLRINHILGKHNLSDRVAIDISANTKGELWYSVTVDGKQRGGSTLAKNTGEDTVFVWDEPSSTLWVVTPDTVSKTDYSKKDSSNSSSQNIQSASDMNPPEKVVEVIGSLNKQNK